MTCSSKSFSPLSTENIEDILKKGYEEMGEINLSLAEEGIYEDSLTLLKYEKKLAESE